MDKSINRLLRRSDVENLCGVGPSFIYRHMADGDFPRPVQLGPRAVRWRLSDVEAWVNNLKSS